jgi:hypothetical protein
MDTIFLIYIKSKLLKNFLNILKCKLNKIIIKKLRYLKKSMINFQNY